MIRLAIPNKGRLYPEIIRLLDKIGLEVPENGRKLYVSTNNPNIQVVYARITDIPVYVESGVADLGITGEDILTESGVQVKKLLKLDFGACKIVVAAPVHSKIKSPENYNANLRVATKLTNTAREYFRAKGIEVEIVKLSGALELAPVLGVADVIVDQVSTGATLMANNLQIVDVIANSNIYLIANKKSLTEKFDRIDEIKISMESVITAEGKRYIMANVTSKDDLKKVLEVMPSAESPTIMNLARKDEYAVHTVVDCGKLISIVRKLKQAGAKDILVMNVSRFIE